MIVVSLVIPTPNSVEPRMIVPNRMLETVNVTPEIEPMNATSTYLSRFVEIRRSNSGVKITKF